MSDLLAGKVVLVVGAASGIGRATALLAANEGAQVVVADLDDAGRAEVASAIDRAGHRALSLAVDVADTETVDVMVTRAVDHFGRLDIAVNSAGVTTSGATFHTALESDLDRLSAVNVRGAFACMRAELRQFVSQGGPAALINVAGSEGLIGVPLFALESACKHAVIGLTKTAALEFAARQIRVNAVCPAAIDTPSRRVADAVTPARPAPLGRLGTAEDAADAIVWLASDRSRFITGEALQLDGGTVEAEGQLHPG